MSYALDMYDITTLALLLKEKLLKQSAKNEHAQPLADAADWLYAHCNDEFLRAKASEEMRRPL